MDKTKKEMYEVFIDSLEKSRTKEGKLLFDKLFEDVWIFVDKKLNEALILPVVSRSVISDFKCNYAMPDCDNCSLARCIYLGSGL